MDYRRAHQPPPSLLGLMMNYCFRKSLHSSFPEKLAMPFQRFVLRLFFSDILSLRYPDTNRIWISVRYDGWDNFPRVMTLILWWPGNMMSCLAPPLAGGPIIIDSFSTRLSIHPWGNCKTYSSSYSWWILRVSRVWSSHEDHVNAISKHVNGTPIFNRNIWSTRLNFIYHLS